MKILSAIGLIFILSTTLPLFVNAQQPAIISFSPIEGAVGTLITITGTNLVSINTFTIGGTSAIVISNTGSILVPSPLEVPVLLLFLIPAVYW